MPLNDTDTLRNELEALGESHDIDFLDRKLRAANRALASAVGRQFVDKLIALDDDQEDFDLAFDEIESFDTVRAEDDPVDSSNFSTDLAAGTISFTTSWAEDNIVEHEVLYAYYTPTIFKDLELAIAKKKALRMSSIVTADEEGRARVQELKEDIREMKAEINQMGASNATLLDHQNRFGGRIDVR